MSFDPYKFIELFASFFAVTAVLTLHEFSHAFVAYKCGDPTAKWAKRLSLNPLRHFDIVGLICFTLVGFGWAKPVPINPNNFKKYRTGLALTASAGVITNYLSAFVFYPLCMVVLYYMPYVAVLSEFLNDLTYYLFAYSLSFCVFNLLPFYPLDGFRIVEATSRRHGKVYQFLRKYGYYILLFLIIESFICNIFVQFGQGYGNYTMAMWMQNLNILGWFMRFGTDILGWPISALWGLVPW